MIDCSRRGFDVLEDMNEVDQFGYLNLCEAYVTGTVEGSINPDQLSFNDIDEPASILGRPADEFDAIRMHDYVVSIGRQESSDGKQE